MTLLSPFCNWLVVEVLILLDEVFGEHLLSAGPRRSGGLWWHHCAGGWPSSSVTWTTAPQGYEDTASCLSLSDDQRKELAGHATPALSPSVEGIHSPCDSP